MRRLTWHVRIALMFFVVVAAAVAVPPAAAGPVPERLYGAMQWRLVGPFRGGRALAVSGVRGRGATFYFGAVGGGVWKTVNAGETWTPLFDGQPVASIGALAVAPSNPNVIYVGTGEADMRSDISFGAGMFKSSDGGATWTAIGLRETRQIGRILVDPRNPDVVLVAALGHAYGPNPERGVFRTTDGGRTWTKTLYRDDQTGAIDLAAAPDDFNTIYAGLWNARRPPFSVYAPSNGPGGGLFKSIDGGATWHELTGNGLPSGTLGRMGVAVAGGQHGRRVYALIDAEGGGLYRSDDTGEHWTLVGTDRRIRSRAWYFSGVTVDPKDADTVYVCNVSIHRSTDGGRTFVPVKGAPGGDDYHSIWIDPDDNRRMIFGSDQGVGVSLDGGATWSSWFNQPTAQIYHVATDNRFPYMIYGAQQDSGTVGITSRSDYGQITFRDWSPVAGGESGFIVPDPANPDVVYGGNTNGQLFKWWRRTGQMQDISPVPTGSEEGGDVGRLQYRFPWTAAVAFSARAPYALYQGAQMLFKTVDGGQRWTIASPDLTQRKKAAPSSGDQALDARDETSGVVSTIAPSSSAPAVIWVGTDNGVIQVTRDGGSRWRDVTPQGLPMWSRVSTIAASPFDAATAYAAIDRHERDDVAPYLYRTRDFGKTWTLITNGIEAPAYTFVVREDPKRRGLLYAGTETGAFVSFDDGDDWQRLQLNLPVSSVRDLVVHGDDLVAATHGRGFWVLDNVTPLRQADASVESAAAHLYAPAVATRVRRNENADTPLPPETPAGRNPPAGATIDYVLNAAPDGPVRLEIVDAAGSVVRAFSSADATGDSRARRADEPTDFPSYWLRIPAPLPANPGMNRFVWDLRHPKPKALRFGYAMTAVPGEDTPGAPEGALVLPGTYQVRLTVNGRTETQPLVVRQDPRVTPAPGALARQHTFLMQLAKAMADSAEAAGGSAPDRARALTRLNAVFAELATAAQGADTAPTAQLEAAYRDARRRLDALLK